MSNTREPINDGRPPLAQLGLVVREKQEIIHVTQVPATAQLLLDPVIKRGEVDAAEPLAGQVADRQPHTSRRGLREVVPGKERTDRLLRVAVVDDPVHQPQRIPAAADGGMGAHPVAVGVEIVDHPGRLVELLRHDAIAVPAEVFHVVRQAHEVAHQLQQQVRFLQVFFLFTAVVGPNTALLNVEQLRLDPVGEQELLIARELSQLRNDIQQEIVQLGQNIVAGCHAAPPFLKTIRWGHPSSRFACFAETRAPKPPRSKKNKAKAPSHYETQGRRTRPRGRR
jgi:hypothetical protein